MTGHLSWSDFWSFIQGAKCYDVEMAKQLDLERWLQRLSIKVQFEVLNAAPVKVVKALKPYIYPDVYKKLVGKERPFDTVSKVHDMPTIEWNMSKETITELRRKQDESRPKPKRIRY